MTKNKTQAPSSVDWAQPVESKEIKKFGLSRSPRTSPTRCSETLLYKGKFSLLQVEHKTFSEKIRKHSRSTQKRFRTFCMKTLGGTKLQQGKMIPLGETQTINSVIYPYEKSFMLRHFGFKQFGF